MEKDLDMEMHILNEIISKANGSGADFDENISRNLNEKVILIMYLKHNVLLAIKLKKQVVFG